MIPYKTNTLYFYDYKGRLIEVKSYKIQKDTVLESHAIFEYNSDDQISKQETLIGRPYWGNTSLYKFNKIVYHYDLFGNIIEQENFKYGTNSDPIIIVFQYIYDHKGNWIKKETWMGNAKDNLEKTKIEDRIIEYY